MRSPKEKTRSAIGNELVGCWEWLWRLVSGEAGGMNGAETEWVTSERGESRSQLSEINYTGLFGLGINHASNFSR